MKTSKYLTTITLSILLIIGCIQAKAANGSLNNTAKENISAQISRSIVCPAFITENSDANDVKALIQVTEQGVINVLEVNTANPLLKQYVIAELQKMKINNNQATEKFLLVIKFRVV